MRSPTKIPDVINLDGNTGSKSPNKSETESKPKDEMPKSPLKSFFAKKAAAPPATPKQDLTVPDEEKPVPKRLSLKKPPTTPAPSVAVSVPPSPIGRI